MALTTCPQCGGTDLEAQALMGDGGMPSAVVLSCKACGHVWYILPETQKRQPRGA